MRPTPMTRRSLRDRLSGAAGLDGGLPSLRGRNACDVERGRPGEGSAEAVLVTDNGNLVAPQRIR